MLTGIGEGRRGERGRGGRRGGICHQGQPKKAETSHNTNLNTTMAIMSSSHDNNKNLLLPPTVPHILSPSRYRAFNINSCRNILVNTVV